MLKINVLVVTLLSAITANASPNITFHQNFATEQMNIDSPFYDLSEFGYFGGQLPKVFSLSENGTGFTYLPKESFNEFKNIISGSKNATSQFRNEQKALLSTGKRSTTNYVSMLLRNTAGGENTFALEANHKVCHTGSHAPWHYVVVYSIEEAYITFWKSDVCNGHKGSFNPVCDYYDDPSEVCIFNFKPSSFRVYSGCHHSDGWGSGCSAHTL
ncbi:hypothetical protein N7513_013125 [Penicillium frequentans]|uniref:Uncharacterized protein n=1 Tax=Penicillium frequentans TaxID=3151616 RepID=A0AAD6GJT7_9EURO|nr:hypothetical protein N7513_013125 [Penicillium glabrum]KAJ5552656.1 hypothetical protein N7494_002034 [Penicillium glabrum]